MWYTRPPMHHDYPKQISPAGGPEFSIRWSDGHESVYPGLYLRSHCPCAACIDEWTGRPRIIPDSLPPDVRPLAINLVGRYAIQIDWSDGHTTGIYAFEQLRALCPCSVCAGGRTAHEPSPSR